MEPLAALWGGLVGAAVGSFAATAVLRTERGEPWWRGRSHCPACGTRLGAWDLIPLFRSLLRPVCRHCGAPIAPLHGLAELAAAAIGLFAFARGLTLEAGLLALIGWSWLIPALTDLRQRRLPDAVTLPLAGAGLLLAALRTIAPWPSLPGPDLPAALLGGGLAGGGLALVRTVHARVRGREGLGLGDVKFAAALATFLHPADLPRALALAAASGILHALAVGALRAPERPVPFGPHLALGGWAMLGWRVLGGTWT